MKAMPVVAADMTDPYPVRPFPTSLLCVAAQVHKDSSGPAPSASLSLTAVSDPTLNNRSAVTTVASRQYQSVSTSAHSQVKTYSAK